MEGDGENYVWPLKQSFADSQGEIVIVAALDESNDVDCFEDVDEGSYDIACQRVGRYCVSSRPNSRYSPSSSKIGTLLILCLTSR